MVQRAYRYRFYPTSDQASVLSRTFGCVRLVYNRALDARTAAWHADQRRLTYPQTSAMLTSWKRTEELGFLNEVAAVPLQQSLRHLQGAFVAFWEGRARYPRFKTKRRRHDAAEYTRSAFRFQQGQHHSGQAAWAAQHSLVPSAARREPAQHSDRQSRPGRPLVRLPAGRRLYRPPPAASRGSRR
jgi:hypothetical protein